MTISRTIHCQQRQQQRGIPDVALGLLSKYGRSTPASRGASMVYLDRWSRQELREELSEDQYRRIEHQLNCFLVVANETGMRVITAGHRTRRIQQDRAHHRPDRRRRCKGACK